jgi:ABC-type uncharacterized transport system permease subunit
MNGWRGAALKNGLKDSLAYRAEFLIGVISAAFVPVCIQLILWSSIFQASSSGLVSGMNYADLLAYTWTSLLFSQIRGGDHDFAISEMIRTGSLNNYLLRPVGVLEFTYIRGLGEKLFILIIGTLIGIIATAFTPITLSGLLMGMVIAFLGNIIHFMFGSILCATAFYWENAFAILMVKNMMVSLLCGELLPLTLVPEKYAFIWQSTPFYLYVFGPTQLALGRWGVSEFFHHGLIALVWIFAFWAIMKGVWKFAIHRYQGMGG